MEASLIAVPIQVQLGEKMQDSLRLKLTNIYPLHCQLQCLIAEPLQNRQVFLHWSLAQGQQRNLETQLTYYCTYFILVVVDELFVGTSSVMRAVSIACIRIELLVDDLPFGDGWPQRPSPVRIHIRCCGATRYEGPLGSSGMKTSSTGATELSECRFRVALKEIRWSYTLAK